MPSPQTITQTRETSPGKRGTSPYLFLTMRCDEADRPGARFSLRNVDAVTLGRATSLQTERKQEAGARLLHIGVPDGRMSASHARIQNVLGTWIIEDQGSKNGTFVDGRRTTSSPIADRTLLELGHSFFVFREALPLAEPAFFDGSELASVRAGMATLSPLFAGELARVASLARSRVPMLLQGETGTGKELIARAIHELSGRAGEFVAVNCGALASTLVESELFGYRKGAFTSAVDDRPGLIRSSDRGTLLLDEIGDLPLPAQAALLRVLQEEEVLPVGGTKPVKVDLRVIAATHRDLTALAGEERFRADLLARLDGATIVLPPLRERSEDVGLIVASLLRKLAGAAAAQVSFTSDAARALVRHGWPMNIREMEKCLSSALVLADGGRIELEHLPESVRSAPEPRPGREAAVPEKDRHVYDELVGRLREHSGNVTAVARSMRKARTQVQRWLKRFRIDPQSFHH